MNDNIEREKIDALNLSRTEKINDRLADATHSLWNAIISLNGIFLAFFALLAEKYPLPLWITLLFVILTCLCIFFPSGT